MWLAARASAGRLSSRCLLFGGALGGRDCFEALVRDGFPAFDRKAVGPGGKTPLGPVDGGELVPELVRPSFVELVLVQIGGQVERILVVGLLAGVLMPEPGQGSLDPLSLRCQQLSCPVR